MTNHNPSLTNEQIKQLLESNLGPIHSIVTPYDNRYQRTVEFMDIRHAQKARQAIGISAKIPTISEVCIQLGSRKALRLQDGHQPRLLP